MFICVTNGSKRNAENYDKLLDISKGDVDYIGNWVISKKGITQFPIFNPTKSKLQEHYKRGVNQIVSNNSKTNFTWAAPTGEIIEFIGVGNHLETEI